MISYRRTAETLAAVFAKKEESMSEKEKRSLPQRNNAGIAAKEESYRLAKLLRAGNRELARQLNTKKIRRER